MTDPKSPVSRRNFLRSGLVASAGLVLNRAPAVAQSPRGDTINVAIVGTGAQGRVLLEAAVGIPNIQFKAVCDIWDYSRQYGVGILRKHRHKVNAYSDFDEMMDAEKDLDAIIVATPDLWHAPYSIKAMEKGCHVYCEKLMSHDYDQGRKMVETQRRTGKLLQIGHQRRSNPRYIQALNEVVKKNKLLGRITNINGQWNRAVSEPLGWPEKFTVSDDVLGKYGYKNMHEFRNWRWFKEYGGGPISDLGAHQIDIFNWFLGTNPTSVMADGGTDYYDNLEWYDNVMAIYQYDTPEGPVRAFYQVLTTTSAGGGYFEYFMGDEGSLKISENPKITQLYQEARAPDWEPFIKQKIIRRAGEDEAKPWERKAAAKVDVRETAALAAFELTEKLEGPIHQPHLINFFDAIRGKAELTCPADVGYASMVTILRVNEAVEAARKLQFNKDEFTV